MRDLFTRTNFYVYAIKEHICFYKHFSRTLNNAFYSRYLTDLHLPKLNAECEEYLSKALFVVGEFGGNDYNAPIFSGIAMDQVKTYVHGVVQAIGRGINVRVVLSQFHHTITTLFLLDGPRMSEKVGIFCLNI